MATNISFDDLMPVLDKTSIRDLAWKKEPTTLTRLTTWDNCPIAFMKSPGPASNTNFKAGFRSG